MLGPCEAYLMKHCNCRTLWLLPSLLFPLLFVFFNAQNTTTALGIKTRIFFFFEAFTLLWKIFLKEDGCWELIVLLMWYFAYCIFQLGDCLFKLWRLGEASEVNTCYCSFKIVYVSFNFLSRTGSFGLKQF